MRTHLTLRTAVDALQLHGVGMITPVRFDNLILGLGNRRLVTVENTFRVAMLTSLSGARNVEPEASVGRWRARASGADGTERRYRRPFTSSQKLRRKISRKHVNKAPRCSTHGPSHSPRASGGRRCTDGRQDVPGARATQVSRRAWRDACGGLTCNRRRGRCAWGLRSSPTRRWPARSCCWRTTLRARQLGCRTV